MDLKCMWSHGVDRFHPVLGQDFGRPLFKICHLGKWYKVYYFEKCSLSLTGRLQKLKEI